MAFLSSKNWITVDLKKHGYTLVPKRVYTGDVVVYIGGHLWLGWENVKNRFQ